MIWLYYLLAAGLGLIFGSFFNVVIYRLPRGESLGQRSRCPECSSIIRWYDNIPVLSFILLRAKCRTCGKAISWQYPIVELSSACLFVLIYWWSTNVVPDLMKITGGNEFQPELLIGIALVSVLIVVTGVDLLYEIIPNRVVLTGVLLLFPVVVGCALYRQQPGRIGLASITAFAGGAFFLVAGLLYGLLFMRGTDDPSTSERKSEEESISTGVGMGDVKLMLFTGLALGYFHWYFVIVHIFISTLIGAISAIPLKLLAGKGRKDRVPFGPFLSAGAVITLIWGQRVVDLYLKLLR